MVIYKHITQYEAWCQINRNNWEWQKYVLDMNLQDLYNEKDNNGLDTLFFCYMGKCSYVTKNAPLYGEFLFFYK